MTGAQIRGVVGQIKWAYYNAAAINGYVVTRSKAGQWSLSGAVVMSDSFKLKQRPLFFVAPHDKGEWRWPIDIETMQIAAGRITAHLGAPIE